MMHDFIFLYQKHMIVLAVEKRLYNLWLYLLTVCVPADDFISHSRPVVCGSGPAGVKHSKGLWIRQYLQTHTHTPNEALHV